MRLERLVAWQLLGYLTKSKLLPIDCVAPIERTMPFRPRPRFDWECCMADIQMILLRRTEVSFGIGSTAHNWFASYLGVRRQCDRCGSMKSSQSLCCLEFLKVGPRSDYFPVVHNSEALFQHAFISDVALWMRLKRLQLDTEKPRSCGRPKRQLLGSTRFWTTR